MSDISLNDDGTVTILGPVGIGVAPPDFTLHVAGGEIHSSGHTPGYSFADRSNAAQRWVWYAQGGSARLFSQEANGDVLEVAGDGTIRSSLRLRGVLQVEGQEVRSSGEVAGYSFADRSNAAQRWVWYAQDGSARLWSGADKISVDTNGSIQLSGDQARIVIEKTSIGGTIEPALRNTVTLNASGLFVETSNIAIGRAATLDVVSEVRALRADVVKLKEALAGLGVIV